MTTDKLQKGSAKGKAGSKGNADRRRARAITGEAEGPTIFTLNIDNLPALVAAVLSHPDCPAVLRSHMRYGLSEVFNELEADSLTDSAEYLALLFEKHAEGGAE